MKNYLVLPINNNADLKEVNITSKDNICYGLVARIDSLNPSYFAYVDITFLKEIKSVSLKENEYSFANKKPDSIYKEKYRPKIHYTVSTGWNNDPNGMVYYDGIYHMFYQYNPAGNTWNNMHWGHATSTDMIHFKEQDVALFPDYLGAIYSGSAIVDYDNVTGLKENENDPIILFYTSAGYRFNQCVAYSTDKGKTFNIYKHNPIITYQTFWNRDPKVIRCDELNCYILALYLENNTFVLYKSNNLLDWQELQKVDIAGDNECPDIYKIKVDKTNEYVYVLQGAYGCYKVGKIENGKFVFEDNVKKCLYGNYMDYAGQSYSNIDNRIIRVNWQKSIVYENMPWGSNLSLPEQITMHKDNLGNYYMKTYIAKEFDLNVKKHPYECKHYDYDCGFDINAKINVNDNSIINCFGIEIKLPEGFKNGKIDIRIIVDTIGISFYINDGIKCSSIAKLPDYNAKPLEIKNGVIESISTQVVESFI